MNGPDYDVVIVGARCAGASLATFLARQGASILLLDKDELPSDQVISTHTIHPPGTDILDELGVGEALRRKTPAMSLIRFNKGGAAVDLQFEGNRAEYCPRRKHLDDLLQHAAVEAGVELHDRTRITDLLWDGERVAGVRVIGSDGAERSYRAALIVGADGRHSTVARLVGAAEYLGYDAPRGAYWGYWETPPIWKDESIYPFDMYLEHVGETIRFVFQTDDAKLLISGVHAVDSMRGWRSDPLGALTADLATDPVIAPLIEGTAPTEQVRGTVNERYFFREGTGPGWALAGDSGHHKEFVLGDGITEALFQARSLSAAIAEGTDKALIRWWRRRDVEALPFHFFGQDEGAAGPVSELDRVAFAQIARHPDLVERLTQIFEHRVSPYELVPVGKAAVWMLGAFLRGKWQVLPEFLAQGRRGAQFKRELKARKRLLAEAA